MFTKSLWNSFSDIHDHPRLQRDIAVDVAVIGGGVTGISAGKLLAQKGMNVAILESHRVGGGTSSHSTGNLYYTIDKILSSLQSKYDNKTVKAVAESRSQAVEQIALWVREYELDCDFKTVPWYLYSHTEASKKKIEKELRVGEQAGLSVTEASKTEIPFPAVKAAKIPGQAQINPMRYVQELAKALQGGQCRIYEHTHVESVKENNNRCILSTSGGTVTARYAIHATHTPKGVMLVQSLLGPYREYGIACKTGEHHHPEGIFWGYFGKKNKLSTRTYSRNGEDFLIVVGAPHKVGHADSNIKKVEQLEEFARKYFDVREVAFRWGGQHYRPADLLPYIGRRKKNSREFIATGYSTDGLVYGTLAGIILSDIITGQENAWAELYDSTRKQPLKSASKFLKENLDVARHYLKDIPGTAGDLKLDELKTGEGRVVEKDGQKLAAYRDENENMKVVSAVCTHMDCIVRWNNAEKSWDCPCHGSRFKVDGTVLEGPALLPLNEVHFTGDSVKVKNEHQ